MNPHLRGHCLLFDKPSLATYESSAGVRLLLTAVGVELVRIAAVTWIWPSLPLYLLVPLLLALALVAVPFATGLTLSQIGLRPWRAWTLTEKSYFLQVILIANLVFPLVFAAPLRNRIGTSGVASTLTSLFVPYLVFGFYQEVVYRGMLQTALGRRWGAVSGVLIANVIYTFGPLHWVYFASPLRSAVPMFLAVFLIGLYFGIVYARSGNLWLVSVFHAIGNAYILVSLAPGASGTG